MTIHPAASMMCPAARVEHQYHEYRYRAKLTEAKCVYKCVFCKLASLVELVQVPCALSAPDFVLAANAEGRTIVTEPYHVAATSRKN